MSIGPLEHAVILHGDDEGQLLQSVASFLGDDLAADEALVLLASSNRQQAITHALGARGVDLGELWASGRALLIDSVEVRRLACVGGMLDRRAVDEAVFGPVERLAGHYRLRAYGEVAGMLWADREFQCARMLEAAWDELRRRCPFPLLCPYPVDVLGANTDAEMAQIRNMHGADLTRNGDDTGTFSRSPDQQRLRLLVRAGEMFHQSLDLSQTLNNVARLAVDSFADLCLFDLIDEQSERLFVTASAHRDRTKEEALAGVSQLLYVEEFGVHPVVQVTRTGNPFFLPHIDDATLRSHAASRQHEQYMRAFRYRSKIVVPVVAQNHIFGALTFVRTRDDDAFDQADLLFAIEIGRRAGLAVANAKQFHREQYVAETLQRAFLPRTFPTHERLSISAHYVPGSTEADIGGDWYDAFSTGRGDILITIGDVTGKGIEAARMMVLMRQAIRVAALDATHPTQIADVCNRILLAEGGDRLASAFIGMVNPNTRVVRYVSAGHAPPLLRSATGEVRRLESPSAPLGAFAETHFAQHELRCPGESLLVLYTDGVIEISRDAIAGEAMLERVLASEAVLHASNPAEFIERAIEGQAPRDDIAVLALAFRGKRLHWQFDAEDARSAYTLRDEFFDKLSSLCAASEEDLATCGLIFAELIGNAVRHAPGPLSVSLEVRDGDVLLHVIDKGPGFDYQPSLPSNLWAESGRGLFLISAMARRVSVERIPGRGSHITVVLPLSCSDVAA